MPSVASSAHIKLTGFDSEGVDAYSPLEQQVTLTYRAAYHYASANRFEPHTHRGVKGRKGQMVMKRITDSLFDHADKDVRDKLNGLITQVLRKTDAAVCIVRPADRETMPTWFVADEMPGNLTIVALSHTHRDTGATSVARTSGEGIIPTYTEKRLTPEEAGETMPPGEVTVTQTQSRTPEDRIRPLRDHLDARTREHLEFVEEIYRLVAAHAPVGGSELKHIMGRPDTQSTSAVAALKELADAGRVVSRVETDSERRVRGGGEFPKGKRMLLWAIAPGPVPERTELPPNVPTRKSSAEWDREKKERIDGWCDQVLEELNRAYPGDSAADRPRSRLKLAAVTGLNEDEISIALDKLVQLDLVYQSQKNHCFYLSDRRRQPRNGGGPSEEETEAAAEAKTPAAPLSLIEDVAALIARHVDGAELEQLRTQLSEAHATIAKQAKIITGLRATVAAYEE